MQLKVSYEEQRGDVTVVRVEAEAQGGAPHLDSAPDLDSAPELRDALLRLAEGGRLLLVVDLGGVDAIDGKGLGALVGGLKRVHPRGGTLSLVVTSERVRISLTISGLNGVFRVHDTVPGAVEKLVEDYAHESIEQRRAAYEERARERPAKKADERLARAVLGEETRVVVSRGNSYEHLTESISLVKVVSDMDVYDASSVRTVVVDLLKQGRFFLVVDLTASDMLDSTGVGVLVGALKRVHGHAGALALVVTSERMLTQFRVTGLAKVFAIFPTVDQAVEFLGREGLRTDG